MPPGRTIAASFGAESYPVELTDDAPAAVAAVAGASGAAAFALIVDDVVAPLHAGPLVSALDAHGRVERFDFPAGEASKTRETWASLTDRMLDAGLGRDTLVVALGGGVATDLAGFVAATFMRGVPCVQVPTSLLAMVDAAVGAKTGVDTPAGKNLVGAFHPPRAVVVDVGYLRTLPAEEVREGAIEALKHGAILEAGYFESVVRRAGTIGDDAAAARLVVERSIELKADVVASDPTEQGRRAILNFGHTVGHAVEVASGYRVRHGAAVAAGMIAEARIGEAMGVTKAGTAAAIAEALDALGVAPAPLPEGDALLEAARPDKKSRAGRIRCVLLENVGTVARARGGWTHELDAAALRAAVAPTR